MKANIIANYLGTGVTVVAQILALPWYLSALGPTQFGLVAFIIMLQAILSSFDAVVNQALIREIAIQFNLGVDGRLQAASLLFGVEKIYWLLAAIIALILATLGYFGNANWIVRDEISISMGSQALIGAAAIFLVQFPGMVYRNALVAVQAQVELNKIIIPFTLLRHIIGVIILNIWPTLVTYIAWNVGISLLETMIRRVVTWKTVGKIRSQNYYFADQIGSLWKKIAGISGATFVGVVTVQMDKIIVGKMLGFEPLGYYAVASTVAMGVSQIFYPLMQAFLPRAVTLKDDVVALKKITHRLLLIVSILVLCGTVTFFVVGEWLLNVWLRNSIAANSIFPVLSVLLIGSSFNAFYNIGYMHWLVQGKTIYVLRVNLISLILSITITPLLIVNFDIIGAAFGWLVINFFGFVFSLDWLRGLKSKSTSENT